MNSDQLLLYIIPLAVSVIGYLIKEIKQDITMLKQNMTDKVSEQQVRQLVSDKLDPLTQDITEIKEQVTKVLDYLIEKK